MVCKLLIENLLFTIPFVGEDTCRETFAGKVQVAVYDNSFHLSMPDKAYMYAIPYEYYEKYQRHRCGYPSSSRQAGYSPSWYQLIFHHLPQ